MRFILACIIIGLATAVISYLSATQATGALFVSQWFAALAIASGLGAIVLGVVAVAAITNRSNDGDRKAQQIADASLKQITSRVE